MMMLDDSHKQKDKNKISFRLALPRTNNHYPRQYKDHLQIILLLIRTPIPAKKINCVSEHIHIDFTELTVHSVHFSLTTLSHVHQWVD